jgi:hypothetical protein
MENISKRLKCANCNIVICEVLAFIQNKLDVMDEQSIVQICESAFSTEDIELAKSLLFESLGKRPITRKRLGKTLRDLEDIICMFKETDPEQIPMFVAKKLEKLPPVTFDHIDVTVLLKKIVLLEKSIQDVSQHYVTKTEFNERFDEYHKSVSVVNQENFVNMKRGSRLKLFEFDSGPMALQTLDDNESSVTERDAIVTTHPPLSPELPSLILEQLPPPAQPQATASAGANEKASATSATSTCRNRSRDNTSELRSPVAYNMTSDQCKQTNDENEIGLSFSEVMRREGDWKAPIKDDKWTLVQRRRFRNQFIGQKGSAMVDCQSKNIQFRAAEIKVPLFISNVHKAVSEEEIVKYVYERTQERVSLVKIKMKQDKGYNAYKVFVTKHKLDTFLDEKLWPSGVSFRRFVNVYVRQQHNRKLNGSQDTKQKG